jgi:hypothetical protein
LLLFGLFLSLRVLSLKRADLLLGLLPFVISLLRLPANLLSDVHIRIVDEPVHGVRVVHQATGSSFFKDAKCASHSEATLHGFSGTFSFVNENPIGFQLLSQRDGGSLTGPEFERVRSRQCHGFRPVFDDFQPSHGLSRPSGLEKGAPLL